jgi:hypothetical protein
MGVWEAMVARLGLRKNDIIVFELEIDCFAMTLIRATTFSQLIMKCKRDGLTVAKTNNVENRWLNGTW